jgi:hypothetical protein
MEDKPMLSNLDAIQKDYNKHVAWTRNARLGSTVKGHWRDYGTHKTWIDEHERQTHTMLKETSHETNKNVVWTRTQQEK